MSSYLHVLTKRFSLLRILQKEYLETGTEFIIYQVLEQTLVKTGSITEGQFYRIG